MKNYRRIGRCERTYAGISYLFYAELALLGLVAMLHVLTGEPDLTYMAKLFPAVALGMGVARQRIDFGRFALLKFSRTEYSTE